MRRTVIVAVSALLALSACDTSGEPSAPPTGEDALTTATAEPAPVDDVEVTTEAEVTTEEPSEDAAPELPDEAKEFTEEGAEAFVEHYVLGLDYAYATGQADHMSALATHNCESCAALLADVPDNPDREPTFQSGDSTSQLIGDDLARVENQVTVLRGSGEGDGVLVFDLAHVEGGWVVDSIRLQEAP